MTKKDKIITGIASFIGAIALVLMTGEAQDGSVDFLWTASWLGVFWASAKVVEKHCPDEDHNGKEE